MVPDKMQRGWYGKLVESFGGVSTEARQTARSHDYSKQQQDRDYVFDEIEGGQKGYMTGQGYGIQPGDRITISWKGKPQRYEVETIEYYSSPPDMWIALLSRQNL